MISERFGIDAKQPRLLRFVQVEAACVVASAHAERNEMQIGDRFGIEVVEFAPRWRVQILDNRQRGFANEREAAGSGVRFGGIGRRVEAKNANGRNDESAAAKEN